MDKEPDTLLAYRVRQLERDQELIRAQMRLDKDELLREFEKARTEVAKMRSEILERVDRGGDGLGKFWDRAIMVLIGLISFAGLMIGAQHH